MCTSVTAHDKLRWLQLGLRDRFRRRAPGQGVNRWAALCQPAEVFTQEARGAVSTAPVPAALRTAGTTGKRHAPARAATSSLVTP